MIILELSLPVVIELLRLLINLLRKHLHIIEPPRIGLFQYVVGLFDFDKLLS